jgi:hypothetical protein
MDPLTPGLVALPSQVSPVLPVGRDVPRDGRFLSPCRWGRSRVVALLRLARPLGTFGRQGDSTGDNVHASLPFTPIGLLISWLQGLVARN